MAVALGHARVNRSTATPSRFPVLSRARASRYPVWSRTRRDAVRFPPCGPLADRTLLRQTGVALMPWPSVRASS